MARAIELFTLRLATTVDAGALMDLESVARSAIQRFRGYQRLLLDIPVVGAQWTTFVAQQNSGVFVAVVDACVVAYCVVLVDNDSHVGTIQQIFVDPKARQLGIGSGLVNCAIEFVQSRKCTSIDAMALPGDRDTKNLYERVGMPARLLITSKNL